MLREITSMAEWFNYFLKQIKTLHLDVEQIMRHIQLVRKAPFIYIRKTIFCTGTSPFIFRNVDISESITVSVEGTTTLRNPSQTVIRTKRGNYWLPFSNFHYHIFFSFCCWRRTSSSWSGSNSCRPSSFKKCYIQMQVE